MAIDIVEIRRTTAQVDGPQGAQRLSIDTNGEGAPGETEDGSPILTPAQISELFPPTPPSRTNTPAPASIPGQTNGLPAVQPVRPPFDGEALHARLLSLTTPPVWTGNIHGRRGRYMHQQEGALEPPEVNALRPPMPRRIRRSAAIKQNPPTGGTQEHSPPPARGGTFRPERLDDFLMEIAQWGRAVQEDAKAPVPE